MPRPVQAGQAPCGRVEGEGARLQLVDRGAVVRAAVALAEALLLEGAGVRGRHEHDALAEAQRGLDRVGQARGIRVRVVRAEGPTVAVRVAHDEAVDDDLDAVALVLVERGRLVEVHELAVHADAHEALAASGREDALALRLAVLDERTEHEDAAAVRAARGCGRRSAARSCARSRGRSAGSAGGPRARRAGAGGRRSRSPCRRWSAGCGWRPSGRWRWPARAPRCSRRPASPSGPGTGGHRRTATPRSGAGPRRRWCRRRGWTCRCRRGR